MIEVDGSEGEGGGQIIRTSIALSAITGKPVKVFNIRKGRPNPGLQSQHLEGVNAIAKLFHADIKGNKLGSIELEFHPKKLRSHKVEVEIPTAGSIGLVLQSLMIAATHCKENIIIEIKGGATNGKWAPPLNYIRFSLLPLLKKFGYHAEIEIKKYGYYPKGGSHVVVTIHPSDLKPVILTECGGLIEVVGISHASESLKTSKVAERQAEEAEKIIKKEVNAEVDITSSYVDTLNPGSSIELFAITENSVLGSDALGELKKKAEDVGKEAALKLVEEIKSPACIDEHAEDQLLPFMALATDSGESKIKVPVLTGHTRTNIMIIEKFLPVKFEINEKEKIISCRKIE